MSEFGRTLFNGSKFIFWTLSPFILIFLIAMTFIIPIVVPEFNWKYIIGIVIAWIAGVSLILGLFNPEKYSFCLRIVTGLVFVFYCIYALYELMEHYGILEGAESHNEPSPKSALLGLMVIGIPSLVFTIFGRFSSDEKVLNNTHFEYKEGDDH
jgi:hypothetical protein